MSRLQKTTILIFGITGDLSTRKLLPALSKIVATGECGDVSIVGVSRRSITVDELLASAGFDNLADRTSILSMDISQASEYDRLSRHLALDSSGQVLVYLAVPPSAATQIVDFIGAAGMCTPNVKILFEKPFGVDYDSAVEMIGRTSRYFKEDQLYRIDHYLAKEMAQNIIAVRGGNALFSQVWSNKSIEAIEVIASETLGVERRGGFYEQTGALRDIIQGHLLQLLALTLMDIPPGFDWKALPKFRLAALEALRQAKPDQAIRAQYKEYQDEVGNPGSLTETFASLTFTSTDPTWHGVPLTLTTGKMLDTKFTLIRIHLKKQHEAQSNILEFRIQPDEGIRIELYSKKPGYNQAFEVRHLGFSYPDDEQLPEAYEQVLVDAIRSQKSLFTTSEEVLRSWQLLALVQQAWSFDSTQLYRYQPGVSASAVLADMTKLPPEFPIES